MALTKFIFKPGITRENTNYASSNSWYDGDKVRFRYGLPEKIGGWTPYNDSEYIGTARALFCWAALSGKSYVAVGTNVKYYAELGGIYNDITPIRKTTDPITDTDPIVTADGSSIITITDSAHGAGVGDYVTISGAEAVGGISDTAINKEFCILSASANSYTVDTGVAATSTDAGGGTDVAVEYQISAGSDVATAMYGWGTSTWGRGTWGSSSDSALYSKMRTWSQCAFGETHFFNIVGGEIYYWSPTLQGIGVRAVPLVDVAGGSNVPLMALCILMSATDRHLLAFGCNAIGETTLDPLLIRWCDTEDYAEWTPSSTNAAGEIRIGTGNTILTALQVGKEILVFTDGGIVSVQYVGDPYVFGQNPVNDNISLISVKSVVAANGVAYWMGSDKFYSYNGTVDTLPCTLLQYVFSDINIQQTEQFFAGTNEGFNEVWWFYCSGGSNTIDRYIIYNYVDKWWSMGTMERTAWLDTALKRKPIAAADNALFNHEDGVDGCYNTPISAWIESSDFDLQDGNSFAFVNRILPDVDFVGSTAAKPAVVLTLTPRRTPGSNYGTSDVSPVATAPAANTIRLEVPQFTEQCNIRLRGRQMKFKIESNQLGCQWKLGVPRLDMRLDGKK